MRLQLNFRVQNLGTFPPLRWRGWDVLFCIAKYHRVQYPNTLSLSGFLCVFSFKQASFFQLTAISCYLASVPGLQLASNGPLCFTVRSTDTKHSHFLKKYLDFWNKNTMLTQSTKISISLHHVWIQLFKVWLFVSDGMLPIPDLDHLTRCSRWFQVQVTNKEVL